MPTYEPNKQGGSPEYFRPSKAVEPSQPFGSPAMPYSATEPSHPLWMGYLLWCIGFTGAHRFYYGRPLTGILWFFTGGLFLIGWLIDIILIPGMSEQASRQYPAGRVDYNIAWLLHIFLGMFGVHRFYMGKLISGVIWLITAGLFGIGYIYDTLTLNDQVAELNT